MWQAGRHSCKTTAAVRQRALMALFRIENLRRTFMKRVAD